MTTNAAALNPETPEPRDEATFTKHTQPPNNRQYTRYSVDLDVTMVSDHNFYAGFAENLSAGGIFIATHMLKPVGEMLDFSINLPGIEQPVTGVGEVRWVREYNERSNVPPGMGLRFVDLAEGSAEAIEQFLRGRDPLFYDDE